MSSTAKIVTTGVLGLLVGVSLGFSLGAQPALQGALMGTTTVTTTTDTATSPTAIGTVYEDYGSSASMDYELLSPCLTEDGTLSFYDPRLYGIEVAQAQTPKPNPPPCPAPAPYKNKCGAAVGGVCGGTCKPEDGNPVGSWCQPDPSAPTLKCHCRITDGDSKKCGIGGDMCGGKCNPIVVAGDDPLPATCAGVQIGGGNDPPPNFWCMCLPNSTLPCRFISGQCPVGGRCNDPKQVCEKRGDDCKCFDK